MSFCRHKGLAIIPVGNPEGEWDMHGVAYYREKAAHFREIAKDSDPITAAALIGLAEDFEAEARRLEPDIDPPMPPAC